MTKLFNICLRNSLLREKLHSMQPLLTTNQHLTISRIQLEDKLTNLFIDRRLLYLIRVLHGQIYLKVRCSRQGHLMKPIQVYRGIR